MVRDVSATMRARVDQRPDDEDGIVNFEGVPEGQDCTFKERQACLEAYQKAWTKCLDRIQVRPTSQFRLRTD